MQWVPPNLSVPILDLVDVIFQLQDGGWIRYALIYCLLIVPILSKIIYDISVFNLQAPSILGSQTIATIGDGRCFWWLVNSENPAPAKRISNCFCNQAAWTSKPEKDDHFVVTGVVVWNIFCQQQMLESKLSQFNLRTFCPKSFDCFYILDFWSCANWFMYF